MGNLKSTRGYELSEWGIKIVCVSCGRRSRRNIADLVLRGDMKSASSPLPILTRDTCFQCGDGEAFTDHFVDVQEGGE